MCPQQLQFSPVPFFGPIIVCCSFGLYTAAYREARPIIGLYTRNLLNVLNWLTNFRLQELLSKSLSISNYRHRLAEVATNARTVAFGSEILYFSCLAWRLASHREFFPVNQGWILHLATFTALESLSLYTASNYPSSHSNNDYAHNNHRCDQPFISRWFVFPWNLHLDCAFDCMMDYLPSTY